MKNGLIGAAIATAILGSAYAIFSPEAEKNSTSSYPLDTGAFVRTDNPTQTRTHIPTGEPDKDCGDFGTHSEAQAFFESHDPVRDPHNLDQDGDGKACESLQ
jgi:micrococcal nuclease